MKKLLLSIFLLLLVSNPAYALIETINVDKDTFQYEVAYQFATVDVAKCDSYEISTESQSTAADVGFYYVIPRDGRVVGMSVAGNAACTAGAATFDITINGNETGVQTVIEPTAGTARSAVGITGAADPQYAYIRQDRADTRVARGFRTSDDRDDKYDAEHPYGKATALTAGNRIGARVTITSNFAPKYTTDYVVVIYVLE